MGKILAIGGGHIGETIADKTYPVDILSIDKEIIRLSKKDKPKLLFIPTASSDSKSYSDIIHRHFGSNLGCQVDTLYLIKGKYSLKEIEKRIFSSDIIYVGGGNTLKMMNIWRKYGMDKILLRAYDNGTVISGISAGAICWFRCGNSDSRKFKNQDAKLIKVTGLGMIDALCCPHYDKEEYRKPALKTMMKKTSGIAIAMDNCTALEITEKNYRIIYSKKTANAYKVYWKNNKYHEDKLPKDGKFRPLEELLSK